MSQFDNSVAEDAGLLKMDFLGLKTLTIIRDAVQMIDENHGVKLDMDEVDLADELTYQLFPARRDGGGVPVRVRRDAEAPHRARPQRSSPI